PKKHDEGMTFFRNDKPGTSTAKIRAGYPAAHETLLPDRRGGRLFLDLGADGLPPPGRRGSPGYPDPRLCPGVGGGDTEV
ncbi:MAG: hypothetical protein V1897_03420, partial [Pseudomonadota bacterium]